MLQKSVTSLVANIKGYELWRMQGIKDQDVGVYPYDSTYYENMRPIIVDTPSLVWHHAADNVRWLRLQVS
jgi:hypothetical protein